MRPFVTFFLLLIVSYGSFSQQVEDYIKSQETVAPFQKLYLHTDREFYFENDTIWFCAYHVDGQTHIKDQSFCNLYVDMVNGEGEIILDEMFIIGGGIASGYIILDVSLFPEGIYMLRAYTDYLTDFGDDAIFTKAIDVSAIKSSFELDEDRDRKISSELVNQQNPYQSDLKIDIDFMPEGGYLLANENNCVAFKAIDSNGKPVDVSGVLQDKSENKILEFESIYKGCGKFYFIPEYGVQYTAIINETILTFNLPKAKREGAKIRIVNQDTQGVRLLIQEKNMEDPPHFYLVCIHRGRGLFHIKLEKNQLNRILEIDSKILGIGINRLVLINDKLNPISERMVFNRENAINQLHVGVNRTSFSRREKVELDLDVSSLLEDSLRHVSIAVVDENYVNADGVTQNIGSYLLIDSELKGHIDSPTDYFIDGEKNSKAEKLDLLMLTNGWSNYFWNTINQDSLSRVYEPGLGFTFKGQVKRAFGKKAVTGGSVSMILYRNDNTSTFLDQPIDPNGNFEFNNVIVFDSVTVLAQARNKRSSNNLKFDIQLIETKPPEISEDLLYILQNYDEIPYSTFRQRYLESLKLKEYYPEKNTIEINEVEIKGRYPNPKIKTGVVKKNDGPYKLTIEETAFSRDIISYLAYEVPGIFVTFDKYGELAVKVRAQLGPAAIVIDGFQIITQREAKEYPVDLFETIEIRTPPMSYYLGAINYDAVVHGAILLTTRDNPPEIIKDKPILGGIVERINGFTTLREFYSPKYTPENINSEIPDYRQTLYWNPLFEFLNGFGKTSFFTADNLGRYKIFIEGISENGNIYLGYAGFEVNE